MKATYFAAVFVAVTIAGCSSDKAAVEKAKAEAEAAKAAQAKAEAELAKIKAEKPDRQLPENRQNDKNEPEKPSAVVEKKPSPGSQLPQTLAVRYQGRDSASWSKDLFDADPSVSQQGGLALEKIGKEGLRFMVQGMKSDLAHVRFNSVNLLNYEAVKQYKNVFIPQLTSLLDDESPGVRQFAAVAFLHCGFKEGLPAMRNAHDKEKEAGTKADIARYIAELEKK